MKFDWRKVSRLAAQITGQMIPSAVAVETAIEGIVDSKDKKGSVKAGAVTTAAIGVLEAEGEISGKQYATPRVKAAILGVNNANVELLNALAEAHAAPAADVAGPG